MQMTPHLVEMSMLKKDMSDKPVKVFKLQFSRKQT